MQLEVLAHGTRAARPLLIEKGAPPLARPATNEGTNRSGDCGAVIGSLLSTGMEPVAGYAQLGEQRIAPEPLKINDLPPGGTAGFSIASLCFPERVSHLFPVVLNERWRVADDGKLQWCLQCRRRNMVRSDGSEDPRSWQGSAYCTSRRALLSNIRERAGDVEPAALAVIEQLPETYPTEKPRLPVGNGCNRGSKFVSNLTTRMNKHD